MYSYFALPKNLHNAGNALLLIGLTLLLVGVVGAYWLDRGLGIAALVAAHSLTIIGPTLIKLGYVLRLTASNNSRLLA